MIGYDNILEHEDILLDLPFYEGRAALTRDQAKPHHQDVNMYDPGGGSFLWDRIAFGRTAFDPAFAIDILAVEISGIQSVPDSKNLSECRCTDGTRIWRVLTNIQELKSGTKLPCAVLPPTEMMGRVSEAMFLNGNVLPDSIELGPLASPPPAALDQARAQVLQITKRMA